MTQPRDDFCPQCKHKLGDSAAAGGEDRPPQPDDISVCFYCRTLLVFDADCRVRLPTDEELGEFADDPDMMKAFREAAALVYEAHKAGIGKKE